MENIAECIENETIQVAGNYTTPDEIFLRETRFYIQRILTPAVIVMGIVGNLITVIVLSQRRMKSSTNVYLRALAISDSLYLIFSFLLSLQHYHDVLDIDNPTTYRFYWKIAPYLYWCIDASSGTSTWLTVSFALERYIAVCHPLRGRILCTESRARRVTLGVVLFNILATLTTSFEWELCLRKKKITLVPSTFGKNPIYTLIYYWFSALVFCYIPLLLLCALNTLLVLAVRHSQKQRCGMTQMKHGRVSCRERQENKITMALVAIVLLFIICQTPTTILLILSIFYPASSADTSKEFHNYHRAFSNICNFLMSVNAATNFLLYCAMSDKYRKTLVITLLPCISRHRRTFTASSLASCRSSRCSTKHLPSTSLVVFSEKDNNNTTPTATTNSSPLENE